MSEPTADKLAEHIDVLEWGTASLQLARSVLAAIRAAEPGSVRQVIDQHVRQRRRAGDDLADRQQVFVDVTVVLAMQIDILRPDSGAIEVLDEQIAQSQQRRHQALAETMECEGEQHD